MSAYEVVSLAAQVAALCCLALAIPSFWRLTVVVNDLRDKLAATDAKLRRHSDVLREFERVTAHKRRKEANGD